MYHGLGEAYRNIGQHQKAIEYYQKAQNIALQREDRRRVGEAYELGLGDAYRNIGQYQTAIRNVIRKLRK